MNFKSHLFTLFSCSLTLSNVQALEPLVEKTAEYEDIKARLELANLDTNQDGKVQKEENEKLWKRNKGVDKNNDGGIDLEELKQTLPKAMDTPGKKLMNVPYKKVGDSKLYLDFYFPDVDESKKKPVVVFTHGGGWATGSKGKAGAASFGEVHKALLKEGFCVMSVQYRLVKKGGDSGMRDCVIDCKDAVRFISAHSEELGVDPEKVYTFGDSAGGHLAQMLLYTSSDSLKGDLELSNYSYKTVGGVSWYGPCDFQDVQLFNHDDRDGFRDRFGPRIMGGGANPEDKEELYKEMSPVSYLTENSPPLLMLQGDKDTTIPVKQAYRMQQELKTVKAPVEIVIIKNAGHNWRSVDAPIEPTRKEIIQQTIDFFLKNK